jgi:hypothetical protein
LRVVAPLHLDGLVGLDGLVVVCESLRTRRAGSGRWASERGSGALTCFDTLLKICVVEVVTFFWIFTGSRTESISSAPWNEVYGFVSFVIVWYRSFACASVSDSKRWPSVAAILPSRPATSARVAACAPPSAPGAPASAWLPSSVKPAVTTVRLMPSGCAQARRARESVESCWPWASRAGAACMAAVSHIRPEIWSSSSSCGRRIGS